MQSGTTFCHSARVRKRRRGIRVRKEQIKKCGKERKEKKRKEKKRKEEYKSDISHSRKDKIDFWTMSGGRRMKKAGV